MAPARRWIRLDVTWEESGWLDALDGETAGCWPRLLCMVKRDGVRGRCRRLEPGVLARRWRLSRRDIVTQLENAAIADGALLIEDDEWVVVNWSQYQDKDPTAAERQRKRRSKSNNTKTFTRSRSVTPRHTVTDTGHGSSRRDPSRDVDVDDATHKKKNSKSSQKKWRFVPESWQPNERHRRLAEELSVDLEHEAAKFRDHEFKEGRSDSDRAFNNWLRNAKPSGHRPAAPPAAPADRKAELREVLAMVRRQDPEFSGGEPDLYQHAFELRRGDAPLWNEVLVEAGLEPLGDGGQS